MTNIPTCETCLAEIRRAEVDSIMFGAGYYLAPKVDADGHHVHVQYAPLPDIVVVRPPKAPT